MGEGQATLVHLRRRRKSSHPAKRLDVSLRNEQGVAERNEAQEMEEVTVHAETRAVTSSGAAGMLRSGRPFALGPTTSTTSISERAQVPSLFSTEAQRNVLSTPGPFHVLQQLPEINILSPTRSLRGSLSHNPLWRPTERSPQLFLTQRGQAERTGVASGESADDTSQNPLQGQLEDGHAKAKPTGLEEAAAVAASSLRGSSPLDLNLPADHPLNAGQSHSGDSEQYPGHSTSFVVKSDPISWGVDRLWQKAGNQDLTSASRDEHDKVLATSLADQAGASMGVSGKSMEAEDLSKGSSREDRSHTRAGEQVTEEEVMEASELPEQSGKRGRRSKRMVPLFLVLHSPKRIPGDKNEQMIARSFQRSAEVNLPRATLNQQPLLAEAQSASDPVPSAPKTTLGSRSARSRRTNFQAFAGFGKRESNLYSGTDSGDAVDETGLDSPHNSQEEPEQDGSRRALMQHRTPHGQDLAVALPAQCSRTDGKGWVCRRAVKEGYSMCEHHIGILSREYTRIRRARSAEVSSAQVSAAADFELPPLAANPRARGATLRRTRGRNRGRGRNPGLN